MSAPPYDPHPVTGAPLFRFEEIAGGYGSTTIVRAVSGAVERGRACCILGRNGVGKTTLMRLLTGHLPVTSGQVALNGAAITNESPHRRRDRGMVYCPQDRPVFENLSVKDNLTLTGADLARYAPYLDAFPILKQRMTQLAGTLSGGERKILSFVRGVCEEGTLLLLDEPTEGVQHENIDRMATFLERQKETGKGLLIVEQHLAFALRIAETLIVMDRGEVVIAGSTAALGEAAIERYLHV